MKMTERKKLNIYKTLLFILAFVIAFMPATVSRNLEVNSRVIVEMLGIDGGDGVEVTAQYVTPTEQDKATTKDKVTVKADTLTEAIETLSTALGRRAELGQCSVIVVGKDVHPRELGTLMTATDVTADVYLTAAEDKAKDLVGDLTEFMKKTGVTDADFIAYSAKTANVATTTLLNFLSDLGSASHTAFMPVVQMIESESGGSGGGSGGSGGGSGGSGGGSGGSGGGSGGSGGGSGEGQSGGQKTGMKVEKLALYGEDGRRSFLDKAAARGVAYISAPSEKGVIVCDVEAHGKKIDGVSATLIKKREKIKIDRAAGTATVCLTATVKPNGEKFNELRALGGGADAAVKDAFSSAIERDIRAAYSGAYAVGCDPLFIARQFYRFAPEKDIPFSEIRVKFDVKTVIK